MRRVLRKEARAAHRRRSHDGKVAYDSEWGAECAAADMGRAIPGHRFNHYRCEYCRKWHVGHVPHWKEDKGAKGDEGDGQGGE